MPDASLTPDSPADIAAPVAAEDLVARIGHWYDQSARDLPWRAPSSTPWAILVSEVMAQQTPVARVVEPWARWIERWPTPAALAAARAGDAVRAWGRLGYPRRALRLHAAATAITERHGGRLPDDLASLRALPGVGEYTAAAVLAFAFRRRAVVLDTNVRRVLARVIGGEAQPGASVTRAERDRAAALLPASDEAAAHWSVAVMELGALVCTASRPDCARCPVADECVWLSRGRPESTRPTPRRPGYTGTDRQCRGALLEVLRQDPGTVPATRLTAAWPVEGQRQRALASLVEDGLVLPAGPGYRLP